MWMLYSICVMLIYVMLLDEGSIRVCNVDNMWMLLDEGSIRVCNVDNMWMLLDEGSIIKGV